ncbi:oligosaccharide flippase family protein [Bradyrhizobium sp. LB11.1]|uniref:oligosaccharide flippase family protein n=1 Tax=Bradyrhizobium sp. LB11.1 TaxID=3156326 RepID=UPI0033943B1A
MNSSLLTSNLRKLANRNAIGAATALSMQIAGAGLSLLVSLLLAKLIGAAGLGLYFLSVTSTEIFSTISRLGLETSALKFISIANASAERGTVATVYRKCVGIAALSAAVMLLPTWLILTWAPIGASKHAEFASLVPFLLIALIPVTVLPVQTEAFKALGRPGIAVFTQTVLPQSTLLLLSVVLAWQGLATPATILASYACAFLIAMLLALLRWKSVVKEVWRKANFSTAVLLRTSLPILIVTNLYLVMAWTDTLVLGILSTPEQVGVYGVALRISTTSAFVLIAIGSVVAPQFAALHASGKHAELEALARRSSFWSLVIASPLILTFLLFPAQILGLFGQQFVGGIWPLRLLALAQLVNVSTGQLTSLLIMTGHEKLLRNNMIFSAILNLAGNLVLVPLLGALGAAISTAFSISVMKIISWWIVRYKLRINTLGYLNLHSSK